MGIITSVVKYALIGATCVGIGYCAGKDVGEYQYKDRIAKTEFTDKGSGDRYKLNLDKSELEKIAAEKTPPKQSVVKDDQELIKLFE